MPTATLGWTPEMLKDVSFALDETLARVPENQILNAAAEQYRRKAKDWIQAIRPFVDLPNDEIRVEQTPTFPLTRKELHALRSEIDRVAHLSQNRLAVWRIDHSLGRLTWTATALGFALAVATVTILIQTIVSYQQSDSNALFVISLVCMCVAIMFWLVHRSHLNTHKSALDHINKFI